MEVFAHHSFSHGLSMGMGLSLLVLVGIAALVFGLLRSAK